MKKTCLQKILIGVLLVELSLAFAPAQRQQSTSGRKESGDTSKKTVPRVPEPAPRPPVGTMPVPPPQLFFITGHVLKDDGEPPPFGTTIKLDCGHSSTTEATVMPNGSFGFQVGGDSWSDFVHPDASERMEIEPYRGVTAEPSLQSMLNAATMSRRLLGCEVKAHLDGYTSTALQLDRELTTGQNDFGTIIIYPRDRVKGTSISITSLAAPKDAKKKMEQGRKALDRKKFKEAESLLESAVTVYPQYAEAWFVLGQVYAQDSRADDARRAFMKSTELDANYVNPYVGLAHIATTQENWPEAVQLSDKSLALDPVGFLDAYYINALGNYRLNQLEAAERRARQLERMDSSRRIPQVYLLMAGIMAAKQDRDGAIRELKNYLRIAPNAPNADLVRTQLGKLEQLGGSDLGKLNP